jgi:signal peptidase I
MKMICHKITLKKTVKAVRNFIVFLLCCILLTVVLRFFVFMSFKIPSYSMAPSIETGDYIFVNKLAYGGRIVKDRTYKRGKFESFRVKGFCRIKRNDVMVFNFPYRHTWDTLCPDLRTFYVKRCVALPGDTFYIDKGIYHVQNCSDTLGNYEAQTRFAQLPEEQIDSAMYHTFPYDTNDHWSVRQFGPLYVPKQGDTLVISAKNIALYRRLIVYESGLPMAIQHDTVYLGDKLLPAYVFQKNYYFMAGDWVSDSRDSRYWGLLPEDHIVGKAAIIWKSENLETGKYRWERFFKKIK